jgi:hypothetical protein
MSGICGAPCLSRFVKLSLYLYMRILLLIYSMSALSFASFGQGIVNFANSPTTLVSFSGWDNSSGLLISGLGKWYFGLLISPVGAPGTFTFVGVYATNSATAPGRFVNNGVSVPNWSAGTRAFYQVAAWHSSLGPTFNPAWLVSQPGLVTTSAVGSGVAGGWDSHGTPFPPLPLFGGTGITSGFAFCCFDGFRTYPTGGMPFGFRIFGSGGYSFVVEASTNMAPQSWIAVQTLTNGQMDFSDPESTNYRSRFYRIRAF